MSIILDGVALFSPGDKARFVDAHDIAVHIINVTIDFGGGVSYEVSWIDAGKRMAENVKAFELEPVPVPHAAARK